MHTSNCVLYSFPLLLFLLLPATGRDRLGLVTFTAPVATTAVAVAVLAVVVSRRARSGPRTTTHTHGRARIGIAWQLGGGLVCFG